MDPPEGVAKREGLHSPALVGSATEIAEKEGGAASRYRGADGRVRAARLVTLIRAAAEREGYCTIHENESGE